MDTFYTPEEIATRLKIHLQTVLNYIKDGRLSAVKLDKGYRVSESAINQFVFGSRITKTPEDYLLKLTSQKKYKAYRKTSIKPISHLKESIPNQDLKRLFEGASIKNNEGYRAFPFPNLSLSSDEQEHLSGGILFKSEVTFAGDMFYFAFASTQGEILTAESLWEDTGAPDFQNSIGLLTSIGIIHRGLLFIHKYYPSFKYSGKVNYAFIIDKPAGRSLSMDSQRGGRLWLKDKYKATTEDPIIIEKTIDVSMSTEKLMEVTIEMVKSFFWYFKCDLGDEVIKGMVDEVSGNIKQ